MACSDYNGFSGKLRDAVGRRQTKAWNNGTMPRPTRCDVCYQTEGAIHGHCEDYSTEDVYLPLCITCHLILHMRHREPLLWTDYKMAVRAGFQGEPLQQNNALWRIKELYPDTCYDADDLYINKPRTATALDMLPPLKIIHPNSVQLSVVSDR